ncbi:MAG: hypothetical protein KKG32_08090 [Alphaproteobacteria bacterium]|nr:hypothetical protein [Alphaproteobacteria bacterium]
MRFDFAQDGGIAGHGADRTASHIHQLRRVKAAGEGMQPPRGHLPVRVAARTAHEIELAFGALEETRLEFSLKRAIVTRSGCQCGFEGPGVKRHPGSLTWLG